VNSYSSLLFCEKDLPDSRASKGALMSHVSDPVRRVPSVGFGSFPKYHEAPCSDENRSDPEILSGPTHQGCKDQAEKNATHKARGAMQDKGVGVDAIFVISASQYINLGKL